MGEQLRIRLSSFFLFFFMKILDSVFSLILTHYNEPIAIYKFINAYFNKGQEQ